MWSSNGSGKLSSRRLLLHSFSGTHPFLLLPSPLVLQFCWVVSSQQEEELQEDATIVLPRGITNIAIEIKNGEFCWYLTSSKLTLSGIQMKVERGMRVAVCGMVGSGKSSFLSCILGEILKISGEVRIYGSTTYASQSARIQS